MKKLRKISRKYYLRQIVSCWLIYYMVFLFGMPARVAMATPQGGEFQVGTGVINDNVVDSTVVVNQMESVIHWNNLNTAPNESLSFSQGSLNNAAVLNRVVGAGATEFLGTLNGQNMRIFMINPAGIVFGKSAIINVSQLVASSLNITNHDFLNGAPYTFTGGAGEGVGDVINEGSIAAERIALIGKNVINRGSLIACSDDTLAYVVLAAGNTVVLRENSAVAVDVTDLTGWNPDIYQVRHECGEIEVEGENAQVVLAAGDVWSMAYIGAYSGGGSDAVATVKVDAAGDVGIEDDVMAEAVGDGVDDAIATIEIAAGGDVTATSNSAFDDTEIKATASNGRNNTAKVDISAEGDYTQNDAVVVQAKACSDDEVASVLNKADVLITGRNVTVETLPGEWGDWMFSADSLIGAYAQNAEKNRAKVDITATGGEEMIEDVTQFVPGNVLLQAGGIKDCALVEAMAKDGSKNSADVVINATGNISVMAYSADTTIRAEASNELDEGDLSEGGAIADITNTANVNITAGGGVEIKGVVKNDALVEAIAKNVIDLTPEIEPEEIVEVIDEQEVVVGLEDVELDLAIRGLTNTANVNITANNGNVDVKAECEDSGAEAIVKATAGNEIKVDIDNCVIDEMEYDTTVNLDVTDLENTAGVMISAKGEECSNVNVEGTHGNGLVRAEAYNTLDVEHKGWSEKVKEYWGEKWWQYSWVDVFHPDAPATVNLTADGLQNTTTVDIAADGSVNVMADGGYYWWWQWNPYTAGVEAEAYNSFDMDFDESPTIANATLNKLVNSANIGITAGYDVDVLAYNGGEAGIRANAWNCLDELDESEGSPGPIMDNMTNDAGVTIDAGGSVMVKADCQGDCSKAEIAAEAYNEIPRPENEAKNIVNTANVDITADDEVKVIAKDCGVAGIKAATSYGIDDTSGVTINSGGDVLVLGVDGEASIEATAEYGGDNTANILINAVGGDVKVIDIGEIAESAKIEAKATNADISNTADVTINATATQEVYEREIDTGEKIKVVKEVCVNGGDVKVIGKDGGHAAITAFAADSGGEQTNTANVTIHATAAKGTYYEEVKPRVYDGEELIEPAVYEKVTYTEGGDVKVIGKDGGKAEIETIAKDNYSDDGENSANVLICIDGDLKVKGENYGKAEIEAIAVDGYSNTATLGIGARGEDGVEVTAEYYGDASIGSKAKYGHINTAETIVCTQGGVLVSDTSGYDTAEISAEALYGDITDAYVGICAVEDVIVNAGGYYGDGLYVFNGSSGGGGHAMIRAEAGAGRMVSLDVQEQPVPVPDGEQEPTTANADAVVVSHEGNVEVTAYNGGTAEILADAYGAHTNTANAGVAAGADLSPKDVTPPETDVEPKSVIDGLDFLSGNVLVEAFGNSKAQILAWAHDATPIYEYPEVPPEIKIEITPEPTIIPGENTAKVVICAPGEVRVSTPVEDQSSDAKIKSWAGGWGEEDSINSASTQVYATDVTVDVPDRRGNGITSWSVGSEMAKVPDNFVAEEYDDGRLTYCLKYIEGDVVVAITDGTTTLIVDTYSNRKDCPECPPCPCEGLKAPVAPLPVIETPRVEGCPGLMLATALELGITSETLQVAMGDSLALNPSLQPCEACASIINAAKILRDDDGSRKAALIQMFNSLAPAGTPMSPETEASIAMAFENAPEGSQNALAKEYVDAFVQYASALDKQLGSPVGDSAAFVMGKYGAGITESTNKNVAAYVTSQLQGI